VVKERKECKFAGQENKNTQMSDKQSIQRYVYTNLDEVFVNKFLIILTKWIERLVEKNRRFRDTTPRN
jgi:hypothetical protein